MKISSSALLTFAALALATGAAPHLTAAERFELPPETATFKPGPGVEVVKAQCLVCHSADYVSTQPRLPRAFWKANVQKMKEKFGAPIPADQVDTLVEYLATTYGAPEKKP
ncbi:sulfite:cytochrome C oxidoreductase subunit B [Verrucomicrobiota bacterium]|nr:sulfite:cytochrome C oxidoreductase subunit B [Verrucomicrobiota bacterium]